MRHNLDGLSEVIAPSLTLDYVLVDLARCNIALASEGNVEVTLVVPEIEVDFSAIVEDKDFTVPGRPYLAFFQTHLCTPRKRDLLRRSHCSGIDIHVGIDLD
jgi:hypothetical protein